MANSNFKHDQQFIASRNKELFLNGALYLFGVIWMILVGSVIGQGLATWLGLGPSAKTVGTLVGLGIAAKLIIDREQSKARQRVESRAHERNMQHLARQFDSERAQQAAVDAERIRLLGVKAKQVQRLRLNIGLVSLLSLLACVFYGLGARQTSSQIATQTPKQTSAQTPTPPRTIETGWMVNALAFSPDGRTIAAAGEKSVQVPDGAGAPISKGIALLTLWDVDTLKLTRTIKPPCEAAIDVAFSPDGQQLAQCCDSFHPGGYVWEIQTGKLLRREEGNPPLKSLPWAHANRRQVSSGHNYKPITLSPDKTLNYVSNPDKIKLFDTRTKKLVKTLKVASAIAAFSPNSSTLATADKNGTIQLWRIQ